MIKMEHFKKDTQILKKSAQNSLLGLKTVFVGLRKRPKTTLSSEIQPNLINAKRQLGRLQHTQYQFFIDFFL